MTVNAQASRVKADISALDIHAHTDAADAHAQLAPMLGNLLRGLGAPVRARALAFGVYPQALLTGDPNRHQARDEEGLPVQDRWQGPLPGGRPEGDRDAVPFARFPLDLGMTRPFDVALVSMPYSDVHLRSRDGRIARLNNFHALATEALDALAAGGHAVFLANHTVLDFPDPSHWARLARTADFLGAVRLPSHVLRTTPACDAPVDVLVLRRRNTPLPARNLQFPRVDWSPANGMHESTHFTTYPDRVLGAREVSTDRWGMQQLTVHDPKGTWPGRLAAVFGQIAALHRPTSTATDHATGHRPATPRHGPSHPHPEPPDLSL
ncbi:hypothetical protein ACIG47_19425 [Promicromonospora sp. NPDC052451]|uniref:hypothetical protein n=1 Tax=Promicromonospora sp. NPDC052451 TaxID=3364407 RepID=UPI0037C9C3F8